MSIGRFLAMVGALIWDPIEDRYLILKRSAEKDFAQNVWECGTGRVDQGETFEEAIKREVQEELGVDILIDFIIATTHFFRGEKKPENEMLGVYFSCVLGEKSKIHLSWEHSEYRWVTIQEAEELLTKQNWLVKLMKRAAYIRPLLPDRLIEFNRRNGFDC